MDIIKRILAYSGKYRKKLISAVILLTLLIAVNLLTPSPHYRTTWWKEAAACRRPPLPLLLASLPKAPCICEAACLRAMPRTASMT